jgi:hypothetical protein
MFSALDSPLAVLSQEEKIVGRMWAPSGPAGITLPAIMEAAGNRYG